MPCIVLDAGELTLDRADVVSLSSPGVLGGLGWCWGVRAGELEGKELAPLAASLTEGLLVLACL